MSVCLSKGQLAAVDMIVHDLHRWEPALAPNQEAIAFRTAGGWLCAAATGVEAAMKQVLVVDDSDLIRDLVREMLNSAGYAIAEAGDGVQGLAALRASQAPLVVLLDFEMPNMNGAELLKIVAGEPGPLSRHEFVIITANEPTFPADFIELLRHLSIRVLPKPFKKDDLVALVEAAEVRLSAPREPIPALPDA
jgi:CheY-like chemotaxis protein